MSSSDSEEENIIRYGTPLEPYDKDEVPSKKSKEREQYALDSYGRRRFHGAFTGGFSAGYGNTVDTPEGWTPATFRSSRSEKATVSAQKPEQFMDEEDRSEFGIAPKFIQTRSEFSGQKRQHEVKKFHDGPIPGEPVLCGLLKAVRETAAVKMLRAMGWKPGQGTGERVTLAQKKQAKKVYTCYVPAELRQEQPSESEEQMTDESDTEIDYETLYAPDDYEPYLVNRKNDQFGLGYSGLSRRSVLGRALGTYDNKDSTSHLYLKEKGKKVSIRGQAFGVGAFEAEDGDIYASDDLSQYERALGPPSSADDTAGADGPALPICAPPTPNVLAGFVAGRKPLPKVPWYPAPALPREYAPLPAGARRSRFEPAAAAADDRRDQGLGRHELSAEARGALLGEEAVVPPLAPPPTPPGDTLTHQETNTKDDLLARILGRNVNFVSTSQITSDGTETTISSQQQEQRQKPEFLILTGRAKKPVNTDDMPQAVENTNEPSNTDHVGKNTIKVAEDASTNIDHIKQNLSNNSGPTMVVDDNPSLYPQSAFKPFENNPEKQARYEKFLRGDDKNLVAGDTERIQEYERSRELMEFEQAAKLYRPLTGFIGDRFTHATQPDDAINPLSAVERSRTKGTSKEQEQAAAKGLYGRATRTIVEWHPPSLLCKRFNVPDPYGKRPEEPKDEKPKGKFSIFEYLEASVHSKESFTKEQSQFSGSMSLHPARPKLSIPPPKNIIQPKVPEREINSEVQKSANNTNSIIETHNDTPSPSKSTSQDVNRASSSMPVGNQFRKRVTAAELFLKELEMTVAEGNRDNIEAALEKFDKMEIFQSVFLSDSDNEETPNTVLKPEIANVVDEKPLNIERNTSPPRGIFANINFDELNSRNRDKDVSMAAAEKIENIQNTSNVVCQTSTKLTNKINHIDKDEKKRKSDEASEINQTKNVVIVTSSAYGPALPETFIKRLESNDTSISACNSNIISTKIEFRPKNVRNAVPIEVDSSSSDSWVDLEEIKKNQKVKKKKKVKKHKHKSKHKKKKVH